MSIFDYKVQTAIYNIALIENNNKIKITLDDELGNKSIILPTKSKTVYNLLKKYHHDPFKITKYNPLFKEEHPEYNNEYFVDIWPGYFPSILVTKDIAEKEGYTELMKIDIWPKGADDRFIEIHATHKNIWVYANKERTKALIAMCDPNTQLPIEKLWGEHTKPSYTKKKIKLTKKEHDI